jgi:transcriptional regulator with XRE-family HTH domain
MDITIGERLRQFSAGFGGPSSLAARLGISPQQLNDYLSGRRIPGNKMQARLRDLGCDTIWLITGQTRDDLDKAADSFFIRKARELLREEFAMIDALKEAGFDTEKKVRDLIRTSRAVMLAAEEMGGYNTQKKGRKK